MTDDIRHCPCGCGEALVYGQNYAGADEKERSRHRARFARQAKVNARQTEERLAQAAATIERLGLAEATVTALTDWAGGLAAELDALLQVLSTRVESETGELARRAREAETTRTLSELRHDLAVERSERQHADAALRAARTDLTTARDAAAAAAATAAAAHERAEELEQTLAAEGRRSTELAAELRDSKTREQSADLASASAGAAAAGSHARAAQATEEAERLRSDLAKQGIELQTTTAQRDELVGQLATLSDKLVELSDRLQAMAGLTAAAEDRAGRLAQELDGERERLAQLRQRHVRELADCIADADGRVEAAEQRSRGLQDDLEARRREIDRLHRQHADELTAAAERHRVELTAARTAARRRSGSAGSPATAAVRRRQ